MKEFTFKFDPTELTDFDYELWSESSLISRNPCDYCKTQMAVAISRDGEARAFDEKWEAIEQATYEKIDAIDEEMIEIEELLEDEPENSKLKKKLVSLEKKKLKLEESFDKKQDKYSDRQANWSDKWCDKLSRM